MSKHNRCNDINEQTNQHHYIIQNILVVMTKENIVRTKEKQQKNGGPKQK